MGAAAVWLWGREIEAYAEEKTREARTKVADGVRVVEEKAGHVMDRGGNLLRRVDEFVRDRKEDVSDALQAGQEAIRPTPAG